MTKRSKILYLRVHDDVDAAVRGLAAETGAPVAVVFDTLVRQALGLPDIEPLSGPARVAEAIHRVHDAPPRAA